uniref:Protein SMG9 n=1 Tax=Globisporangium ultimum (strain ATCC 200006 / CBS 805.95 / DAOM BR144) TaxID=431595 RepID=K3X729_GLOUD
MSNTASGDKGHASAVRSKTTTNATAPVILAKHPPTILKAPAASNVPTMGLYDPDAPSSSSVKASPRTHHPFQDVGSSGALHVNTRQGHAIADLNSYGRHSLSSGGVEGGGSTRTLYHPPPSSSPSLKKPSSSVAGPGSMRLHAPVVTPPSSMLHANNNNNVIPPATSVKLITAQYQFATDLSSKLANCLELTNFTVVGVLGFEGVGKSTILSLLHAARISESPSEQTAKQQVSPVPDRQKTKSNTTRSSSSASGRKQPVFSTQSLDALIAGSHETSGVDLAINHDPRGRATTLVLLDTQPMLSTSMLCELLSKNESPRFGALTPEQQVEVASYQLAVFLCSICHYVVIAHDGLADLAIVRFLQQVEQKLQNCRLPHISGGLKEKHVAKLICLVNKRSSSAALLVKEQELLARHVCALDQAWPHAFYPEIVADENKQQIPVLTIPLKPTSNAKVPQRAKPEEFDDAALRWQQFVQQLPNAPSFSKNPTTNHVMNLREWLSNASRIFESVRKSGIFTAEYASARDHH